jgi:hypothetical protein
MDLTSDTIDAEPSAALAALRDAWRAKWPGALACWSRYVQLSEPRWCLNASDEKREHLQGSFAMIRLVDHAVVISLSQVRNQGLDEFSIEIMAHEIGHHVYTPGCWPAFGPACRPRNAWRRGSPICMKTC